MGSSHDVRSCNDGQLPEHIHDQSRRSVHGGQYDNHGQLRGSRCAGVLFVHIVGLIGEVRRDSMQQVEASQFCTHDRSVLHMSMIQGDRKI